VLFASTKLGDDFEGNRHRDRRRTAHDTCAVLPVRFRPVRHAVMNKERFAGSERGRPCLFRLFFFFFLWWMKDALSNVDLC